MLWSQFSAIFLPFSESKLHFSQKTMLWTNFLLVHNWKYVFIAKTPIFFAKCFGRNILEIITSTPDSISRPKCSQVETIPLEYVENSDYSIDTRDGFGSYEWKNAARTFELLVRVARFLLVHFTKTRKGIPNYLCNGYKIWQIAIRCTKWMSNIPHGPKTCQHFPFQGPPK
jgi:hypothetical protein